MRTQYKYAYNQEYYKKHGREHCEQKRKQYANDSSFRKHKIQYAIEYQAAHMDDVRARRKLVKEEVLTYYGFHGTLRCCWRGCGVCDLDMLTLDHVSNDGAEHRKLVNVGGAGMHKWVKNHGYPKGFQTLCANHQLKKEIQRRLNANN